MSVARKIGALMGISAIALIAIVWLGWTSLKEASGSLDRFVREDFEGLIDKQVVPLIDDEMLPVINRDVVRLQSLQDSVVLLLEADRDMHQALIAERLALVVKTPGEYAKADKENRDNIGQAETRIQKASAGFDSPEAKRLYQEAQKALTQWKESTRKVVELCQKSERRAEAEKLTGATRSAVLLVEDAAWLRVAYSSPEPAYFDLIPVEGSLAGLTVRQNEPFLTNAPADESYEYLQGRRPTAFLSVPLRSDGDVIGVLEVVDKPGGFVQDDIRIVSLFANQAAINIEHARLNRQAGLVAVLEERQRLARELHDSVVQSLYSMALYADAAALALSAGKPDVTVSHLQELRDTARSAMYDMRLLIFELHPPALEQDGLVTALRVRLAAVEARAGVRAELAVEGERRLPIAVEQELYRIAQEALNNIMKHARARHVMLSVRFEDKAVSLRIHDDGSGFDLRDASSRGGRGLRSFTARAAKIGGSVTVESQPGQGTTVTLNVATKHGEGAL